MTSPTSPPSLLLEPGDAGRVLYATRPTAGPLAWGVQAYYMRKAALIGVNDATTFTSQMPSTVSASASRCPRACW